ncbi:LysR family transcriptional regulator [Allopusillimonas ginsengisoli]|uniref:LysR family transcriptional regulator n=1 Tax=Allopusillimonas ginsengisoli TaxID=453575 RepID=UPI00102138FE|nr:LysR family transcriptional regulator [Allopusillimonas ginsengisoli]TEA69454.1 LysR family transcriptional regulator [Allopusillimonas ginsengisoli]
MNKINLLQDTALRYFLEVVRRGSISEAAQYLHVSASAVSRQVSTLEEILGTTLFDRMPRGMQPNGAGQVLASYALRVSLDAAEIVSAIDALQDMRNGHIRLTGAGGFAIDLLPAAMVAFREQYPGTKFTLQVEKPTDVTNLVLRGEADMGLTYSRTAHKDIRVDYVQTASVVAVMRSDHALAKLQSVTLKQLQGFPIALPGPETTVRQLFDIACSNRQIVLEPVLECNRFETLFNFVQYGGGLTIASAVSVINRKQRDPLLCIKLREPGMIRSIQIQTLAGRRLPELVCAFIKLLEQRLKDV